MVEIIDGSIKYNFINYYKFKIDIIIPLEEKLYKEIEYKRDNKTLVRNIDYTASPFLLFQITNSEKEIKKLFCNNYNIQQIKISFKRCLDWFYSPKWKDLFFIMKKEDNTTELCMDTSTRSKAIITETIGNQHFQLVPTIEKIEDVEYAGAILTIGEKQYSVFLTINNIECIYNIFNKDFEILGNIILSNLIALGAIKPNTLNVTREKIKPKNPFL